MLVKMKRTAFDSLNHFALGWACIEPTIQQIRGKNLTIKSQVYEQLTSGQRALLMFWIIYGHTRNGVAQFYDEVGLLLSQIDIWSELKKGLDHFKDSEMISLIGEMENLYRALDGNKYSDDSEFHATLNRLDSALQKIIPSTFKKISDYIRNNPSEFVQLDK